MEPQPWVVHEEDCAPEAWDDPARGPVRWRTLLSGDRAPTGSLTLGVAEVGPEASGPRPVVLHRHAQPEAYYVLAGEGVVSVGGREYPLRPGHAVFVPGSAPHGVRNTGSGTLRLLYVFAADSFDQVHYAFDAPAAGVP